MKQVYIALLENIADDKYSIRVPDMPGCAAAGASLAEALDNIRDALAGYICSLEDAGRPVPAPSGPAAISRGRDEMPVLVEVDTIRYRKENDKRAVRKNVSLPSWLMYLADKHNINCSQVLQEALKKQLGVIG